MHTLHLHFVQLLDLSNRHLKCVRSREHLPRRPYWDVFGATAWSVIHRSPFSCCGWPGLPKSFALEVGLVKTKSPDTTLKKHCKTSCVILSQIHKYKNNPNFHRKIKKQHWKSSPGHAINVFLRYLLAIFHQHAERYEDKRPSAVEIIPIFF